MLPSHRASVKQSSQCGRSQGQLEPNRDVLDMSITVLNRHGNHWKHFDDYYCLPLYHETEPTTGSSTQSIEVEIRIHGGVPASSTDSPHFGNVQFTLHGAIKTQVGKHLAVQKVSTGYLYLTTPGTNSSDTN